LVPFRRIARFDSAWRVNFLPIDDGSIMLSKLTGHGFQGSFHELSILFTAEIRWRFIAKLANALVTARGRRLIGVSQLAFSCSGRILQQLILWLFVAKAGAQK